MRRSIAGKALRAVLARRGAIVAGIAPAWQRQRELIGDTRAKAQLLLTDPAALHLMACARAARALPGAFAEAGVFEGGSARLICEQKGEAELHLFDVFESLHDGGIDGGDEVRAHFGAIHGSADEVRRLLAPYPNVQIHAGLFPETARGLEQLRFAFVHLDLDLPGPTRAALEFFHPRLVPGGILIGDDYSDRYVKGCFDEWFATRPDTIIELPWSQVMVVRQGPWLTCRR